jgi:HD-like signal output (HDOD) protein
MRESPRLLHLRAELLQLSNNSTSVAAVAWLLAARVAGIDADEAMFAGLMHNAGKLCILARLDVANELYADRRLRLMLLMRWHAAVAQSLLESWQLPGWLCAAVGAQDTLGDRAGSGRGLNEVLAAAVIAARTSTDIDATAIHLANFSGFGLEVGDWRELLLQAPATTTAMRALFSD